MSIMALVAVSNSEDTTSVLHCNAGGSLPCEHVRVPPRVEIHPHKACILDSTHAPYRSPSWVTYMKGAFFSALPAQASFAQPSDRRGMKRNVAGKIDKILGLVIEEAWDTRSN